MATPAPPAVSRYPAVPLASLAWGVTLCASALPGIAWEAMGSGPAPGWLLGVMVGLVVLAAALAQAYLPLRPLRAYLVALGILVLGYGLREWWGTTPAYGRWEAGVSWPGGMAVFQAIKAAVALAMVGALVALGQGRRDLHLARGDLHAHVAPLIAREAEGRTPWMRAAAIFCGVAFGGGLLMMALTNSPSREQMLAVLPMLPAVVGIAAANALNEEVAFRGCLLGSLGEALGRRQALALGALFFGLAHYAGGFPAGLPWFVLTSFLGWWFGKSMLETRGLLAPWLQHLVADLPVLAYSAMYSAAVYGG